MFEFPINIQTFLPHREPMLMVDDVHVLTKQNIETKFKIEEDNIFLENGFFSEVGLIENAAQTCSGIVGWTHYIENEGDENYYVSGYISHVKSVKIHSLPPVNSHITSKGSLISNHDLGQMYSCNMICETYLGDELLAEFNLNLLIHP